MFDMIIIGSGPAGVTAAREAATQGLNIAIIDAGQLPEEAPQFAPPPAQPFSILRQQADQSFFRMPEAGDADEAAAQLTPNRLHMRRHVAAELKTQTGKFQPFQTLAQGGLSTGWGAACFTYDEKMLQQAGLPELTEDYEAIAAHIGVSGPEESVFCDVKTKQPALNSDSNARTIWQRMRDSLKLEPASMAVLSQDKATRKANPYFDLDFWSDHGRSVWRAQWDMEALQNLPNVTVISPAIALRFEETENTVTLTIKSLESGATKTVEGKTLMIAAGAFGSYRLCANSLNVLGQPNPYLCNAYMYVPTINLAMLGKKGDDRRHSLSQLFGEVEDVTLQFYSYRSLLLQRLIDQTPVHLWLARQFWRLIVESLVIAGCHFPDPGSAQQTLQAHKTNNGHLPALSFQTPHTKLSHRWTIFKELLQLGLVPMGRVMTRPGGSIHYAGTIPIAKPGREKYPLMQDEDNRLIGTKNVYICDNSGWLSLPSRGPTFTLMASARHITRKVLNRMAA